ncbi:MAG: NfeD family protein [Clostridia bacterium]|nr:NfeD family protein [Clostridia bacterium]MBO4429574.1 NfeD family protein [Clostridia bacterium]
MMSYIWLGIIVFATLAEAITAALVSIWFIPSAIVSLVLSLFNVPEWVQIVVFVVLSFAFIIVLKPIFAKKRKKDTRTNADAVLGQQAIVSERICNIEQTGAVKLMGKEWTARSVDDSIFEVGEIVTVTEIRGVKLICK